MTSTTAVARREPARHPIVVALDDRTDALAALLPRRGDVERFKRVVLQALNRNPDLRKCDPDSIVDAAAEAARLGLEPSGAIGGAHLVPYGQRAQLIIDFRGLIELARRSGEIDAISASDVRDGDTFAYRLGSAPAIDHQPGVTRGELTHVYAIAWLRSGRTQFAVMDRAEVDAIRARSRGGNAGPWRTDYTEMAKKTVLRRLCKLLPLTVEAREALEHDEAHEVTVTAVTPPSTNGQAVPLSRRLADRAARLGGDVSREPSADVSAAESVPGDGAEVGSPLPSSGGSPAADGAEVAVDDIPFDVPPACKHPAKRQTAADAGLVCGECGELLAVWGPQQAEARDPRQRLMARLHAEHDHATAKAIAAAVLGIDPREAWSMADLSEADLSSVAAVIDGGPAEPLAEPFATGLAEAVRAAGKDPTVVLAAMGVKAWTELSPTKAGRMLARAQALVS